MSDAGNGLAEVKQRFARAMPEGNMILVGEYIFIFPEPACYKCFNMKQARP
jgi:hypothetical protein